MAEYTSTSGVKAGSDMMLDIARSIFEGQAAIASGKYTVYPSYIASRIKRAIKVFDSEEIIADIGEMQSLGNSVYAIPVTDFNGKKYRITVECE